MSAPTPPVLDADRTAGLRRLKLAAMRQLAPELLVAAKTQRWAPEEVLRALVEAEIAARDASSERARLKAAAFPVRKTTAEFDMAASSIPAPTWAYLTSLEWVRAKENIALIGPAGTGKSHTLIALGHAAVLAEHRVRYLTAADLVETLYRGLADNTVGKTIEALLHNDVVLVDEIGFPPAGRHRRPAALPVRRRRLRTPLPRHRLAPLLRGLGTVPARAHHRRLHARPAPAPRHNRRHQRPVLPHAPSPPTTRR